MALLQSTVSLWLLLLLHAAATTAHPLDGVTPDPTADPRAVVIDGSGQARFTVLTSQLLRMEWSSLPNKFEDRATLTFINRKLNVPPFTTTQDAGALTIATSALTLLYSGGGAPFTASNLQVQFTLNNKVINWTLASPNNGQTNGTVRTLDGDFGLMQLNCSLNTNPDLHCNQGLVSRDGWVLVNDTNGALFDGDPTWNWVLARPTSPVHLDYYFMAYGHDYKQALYDYTLLAGAIPVPPRFAFGVFYSRYWAYSDRGSMEVVQQYGEYNLPLDVLVTDMDWHITYYKEAYAGQVDQAGQTVGWTGYTWDAHLFPEPQQFLDWCKVHGLHNTVNLHPASGVQPHELLYPQMATAMGIDPSTQKYVPFDIENRTYATNLMEIMLQPLEKQGIDFWWLDWQQGESWTSVPGVNPTIWLNHCFFTNPNRWANGDRQMILHRWGGLGNHRYQVGFSGDVVPLWSSLAFQPYFTASAANVGYGFWSHDLGGHTEPSPPELYTRWLQWGAFSPIFRTHCTKDPANDRRIWTYPYQYYMIMRQAFTLRSDLVPYLYSAARTTHDTGLAFLHPLYYDYPQYAEAYSPDFQTQYMYGPSLMVAPVVTPMNTSTSLAEKDIWFPPGEWVNWLTGSYVLGPTTLHNYYALHEIPAFVRCGSVISLLPPARNLYGSAQRIPNALVLQVFPGTNPLDTILYEDDGATQSYLNGAGAMTMLSQVTAQLGAALQITLVIQPTQGTYAGMPTTRSYEVHFNNVLVPSSVSLNGNVVMMMPQTASESMLASQYQTNSGDHKQNSNSRKNRYTFLRPTPTTTMDVDYVDPLVPTWWYDTDTLAVVVQLPATDVTLTQTLTVTVATTMTLQQQYDVLSGLRGAFIRAQQMKELLDDNFPVVFQEDYDAVMAAAETPRLMSGDLTQVLALAQGYSDVVVTALTQIANLTSLAPDSLNTLLAQLTYFA